jgi:uncharacterized protein (TIGR02145 family)
VGQSIWFADYLRYRTGNSYYKTGDLKSQDIDVNEYPNSEINKVCSSGWHVATINEWEEFIDTLKARNSIDIVSYDTLSEPN